MGLLDGTWVYLYTAKMAKQDAAEEMYDAIKYVFTPGEFTPTRQGIEKLKAALAKADRREP